MSFPKKSYQFVYKKKYFVNKFLLLFLLTAGIALAAVFPPTYSFEKRESQKKEFEFGILGVVRDEDTLKDSEPLFLPTSKNSRIGSRLNGELKAPYLKVFRFGGLHLLDRIEPDFSVGDVHEGQRETVFGAENWGLGKTFGIQPEWPKLKDTSPQFHLRVANLKDGKILREERVPILNFPKSSMLIAPIELLVYGKIDDMQIVVVESCGNPELDAKFCEGIKEWAKKELREEGTYKIYANCNFF